MDGSGPANPTAERSGPSRWVTAILLCAIVVLGGGLRLWNLDWDQGAHLHPDERYLAIVSSEVSAPSGPGEYFATDRSPLNPANHDEQFVYGTAPLFTTKAVATWLQHGADTGAQPARAVTVALDRSGIDLLDADGRPRFDGGYDDVLVGRLLSALIDTVTIVVVFALGLALGGRKSALAAALVWATCALAIQHAHFFVVEPLLTLASALALLAAVHVAKGRGRHGLVLGGMAAGLAGASKVSALSVLAVLAAAALIDRWPAIRGDRVHRDALPNDEQPNEQPSEPQPDCEQAGEPASGVEQSSWGSRVAPMARRLGPLAIDAVVLAVSAFLVLRVLQPYMFRGWFGLDPRWTTTVANLQAIQDGGDTPTNVQWASRVPVLDPLGHLVRFGFGIPATLLALAGVARLRRRSTWTTDPTLVLIVGWVLVTSLIFVPRFVPAMRYLLPAYPALAALAGLGAARLLRGRRVGRGFTVAGLVLAVLWGVAFTNGVYGRTNTRLAASQWLVANAPTGSTLSFQEWDDGLPVSSEAATAKRFSTEKLTPFSIVTPDDVRRLAVSLDRIDYVVESSDRVTATVTRIPGRYDPVLRYYRGLDDGSLGFEPVASFTSGPSLFGVDIDDGGSQEPFRVYDHPPVRIWRKTASFSLTRTLAVLQPDRAVTAERVPLDDATANGLLARGDIDRPGRGPTFDQAFPSRLPVAWLWWLGWWELTALASLPWVTRLFRLMPERGLGLAKVLGPLAVVVPLWLSVATGIVSFSIWSALGATVLAVGIGLGVPSWRRDARRLWTTHRRAIVAVEIVALGVFAAVLALRAANPDLWFHPTGGEKPFDTAFFTSVARSSSFPPSDPWFSGGTVNYFYGGWFSMAVPSRLLGIRPEVALNLAIATAASLLASVAWSLGAALSGLRRAARGRASVFAGVMASIAVLGIGNLATARQQIDRVGDAMAGRVASPFDWWGVSRLHAGTSDINEFPAWTVLFGDPHPHLFNLPVLLAIVGVALAYVVTRQRGASGEGIGLAVVLGLGIAWTRVSHTWDLPTVIALGIIAAVLGSAVDTRTGWRPWRTGVKHLAAMGALGYLVALPYSRAAQVFDAGFTSSNDRTPLGSFLLQLGIPIGVAVVCFLRRLVRAGRVGSLPPVLSVWTGRVAAAVVAAGAALLVVATNGPVVAVAAAVVLAATVTAALDLRRGDVGRALAAGLVALGAGLAAFADVFLVVNDIGRQNTVFKFGLTAWSLLAVGAAALAFDLVASARHRAWWGALVLAAAIPGLLFWPSATPPRLEARFSRLPATLDGRAWLHHGLLVVETQGVGAVDVTTDEAMIDWLRGNVAEGDTLVEGVSDFYTWAGRVSVATGIPTVIGWEWHQTQQRRGYTESVQARVAAVQGFYRDPDREQAERFLAAYRPDYVVVGTVERATGTTEAINGFGTLPGLSQAWRGDDEIVYRVDHPVVDRWLARLDAERIQAGASPVAASANSNQASG